MPCPARPARSRASAGIGAATSKPVGAAAPMPRSRECRVSDRRSRASGGVRPPYSPHAPASSSAAYRRHPAGQSPRSGASERPLTRSTASAGWIRGQSAPASSPSSLLRGNGVLGCPRRVKADAGGRIGRGPGQGARQGDGAYLPHPCRRRPPPWLRRPRAGSVRRTPVAVLGGRPAPPTGGEAALPRSRPRRVQRLETLLALRSPPLRSRGGTAEGQAGHGPPPPPLRGALQQCCTPAGRTPGGLSEREGRRRPLAGGRGGGGRQRRVPPSSRAGAPWGRSCGRFRAAGKPGAGRTATARRAGRCAPGAGSPAGPVPCGRWRPPLPGAARHGACTRAGGSRITAPARGNVTRGPSGGSGRAPAARRRGAQPQVATAIRGGRPAGKGVRRRSPHRERPNVDARGRPLLHCPVITVRQTRLIGRGHPEARPPTGGGPRPPGAGLFAFGTAPARTERRRTVRHPVRDSRLHAHTTAVPG
ncbi:hypothetical protein HDA36_000806 [Nocardiopsis composta]|uniref:Uncharacterized protein n=1 Tax=Nocardiopsis composta TaxID=157465 RepID=A0A7W8VC09_9ACTN|nr:hypothetical protein [Nocardiopsis composta]